jgi:hypothetical protein
MELNEDTLLQLLGDMAVEDAEDISLDIPLRDIVDLSELQDKLDFEVGVTPPMSELEGWNGRDLLDFYKG